MNELSEEDENTVARLRKIQRFLSHPFQVAEIFTDHLGKLVQLPDTIIRFQEAWSTWILSGFLESLGIIFLGVEIFNTKA